MIRSFIHTIVLALFSTIFFFTFQTNALTNSPAAEGRAYESHVFIRTEAREDGAPASSQCNATLIAPRLLVSAAHCVSHAILLSSKKIDIEFGAYRYVTKPGGKVVRVGYAPTTRLTQNANFLILNSLRQRLKSGGFKTQIPPYEDIALVVLDTPIQLPVDFYFTDLLPQKLHANVLTNLQNFQPNVTTINYWEEVGTDFRRSGNLNKINFKSSGYFESTSFVRLQAQDSGGALTITILGKKYLIGVVKGQASNFFSNWDVYGFAGTNICKISAQTKLTQVESTIVCP